MPEREECSTNLKAALRPFHRRVRLEVVLKAFFCAIAIATSVGVAVMALLRLVPGALSRGGAWALVMTIFTFCFAALYLIRRPSWKQTALRIDGVGLGERIATMVEFQNRTGDLYDLQRQDAMNRLKAVSPRQIALNWPKAWMIADVCLLALIVAVVLSPASLWQWKGQEPVSAQVLETEEMLLIREMIQNAADQIDASDLSEEEKQALRMRLQELMDQIEESGETGLALLASAVGETELLLEDLGDLERVNTILGELMKTVLLRDLAVALSALDEGMAHSALRALQDEFLIVCGSERQQRLEQAAEEIIAALARVPGAKEATVSSDYLAYCFSLFAGELRVTAQAISVGLDGAEEIEENIRQMYIRLEVLLAGDETNQARKKAMGDLLAQQETAQADAKAGGAGDNANGTGGDGYQFSSQMYTVGTEGVSGGLEEERERFSSDETVYDPSQDIYLESGYAPGKKNKDGSVQRLVVDADTLLSGSVHYQQIYGVYYARLLERMEQLSPESLELVELYFDSLIRPEKAEIEEQ